MRRRESGAGGRCAKHYNEFPRPLFPSLMQNAAISEIRLNGMPRIFLDELRFNAVTVNAYMGKDSVAPFIQSGEQCAFILAVTSNPGARDFQYLKIGGKFLYEKIIAAGLEWNVKKNVGFVIGATKPKELQSVRKKAPAVPLLIPGVGTQGGA